MESNPEQEYLRLKEVRVGNALAQIKEALGELWEHAYDAGHEYGFDCGWTEGVLDYKGERKFL